MATKLARDCEWGTMCVGFKPQWTPTSTDIADGLLPELDIGIMLGADTESAANDLLPKDAGEKYKVVNVRKARIAKIEEVFPNIDSRPAKVQEIYTALVARGKVLAAAQAEATAISSDETVAV